MSAISTLRQDHPDFAAKGDAYYQKWLADNPGASDSEKQQVWEHVQGTNPDTSGAKWADPLGRALVSIGNPLGMAIGSAVGAGTARPQAGPTAAPGLGGGVNTPPGYQVNEQAWAPPTNTYGDPAKSAELTDRIAQMKSMLANAPDEYSRRTIQAGIDDATKQLGQLDQNQFVSDAKTAGVRAAPGMKDTQIDFSGAAPAEERATSTGDLQLDQAKRLQSGASGAGQGELINTLKRDMAGGQPSLAEAQLRQGADENMRRSLSIAASARGGAGNQLAAQLAALQAGGDANQLTNQSAAILRAKEYADAREGLGTALNQQRTGGIQEQGIAATEIGAARTGDINSVVAKYNNAVQQGLITDADARAKLAAELSQRGMNDAQVQYYTNQYVAGKNNAQQTAIDLQKTKLGAAESAAGQAITTRGQDIGVKNTADARSDANVNALIQGGATTGKTVVDAFHTSGVQAPPGASGAASGQGAYNAGQAPTPYTPPPQAEVDPLDPGY